MKVRIYWINFQLQCNANAAAVQDALVAKLESELNLEDDVGEPENYSDNIKDYLENSPFEIKDVAGQEEVVLTRKYNNEKYATSRHLEASTTNIFIAFASPSPSPISTSPSSATRRWMTRPYTTRVPTWTLSPVVPTRRAP